MAVKFANNVSTTLSAAINATQTTISVADASGLPTLSSGDYVYLTIDTDTTTPTIEVVKVTAISSNDLTVVRGQDGTTASSFSSGTKVELRVTAAALDDISSAADTESVSISGDTMTGTLALTDDTAIAWGSGTSRPAIVGNTADDDLDIYISGNSIVNVDASGIDVTGDLNINSTSPELLLKDSSQTGRQTQITQSAGIAKIRSRNNASNGQIVFEGYTPSTTTEYARIDASGNVLVGTTTSAPQNFSSGSGTQISDGYIAVARGGAVALLNRVSTDGDIVEFKKDGSAVGSIGVQSDRIYLAGANEAVGIDDSWGAFVPLNTGGGNSDADTDLGVPSSRFKNLYLSGSISSGTITSSGNIVGVGINSTSNYTELGSTSSSNLIFKRNNASYIQADHADGYFIFITGGRSTSYANRALALTTDNHANFGGDVNTVGNVTVGGNLTVNGTTTTLNTATLNVEDKNIVLNYASGDTSGSANGAGITIQDAVNSTTDATILWDASSDRFEFSNGVDVENGGAVRVYRSGNSAYGELRFDTGENLDLFSSWGNKYLRLTRDGHLQLSGTTRIAHNGDATLGAISSGAITTTGDVKIYDNANDVLIFGSGLYQTIGGSSGSNNIIYRTYSDHIFKTGTGASSKTDGTERFRITSNGVTVAGTVSTPYVRVTGTGDASLSSTTHGIQVGATSGQNLLLDNNEVLSRNNGVASHLHLQADGGTVTVGAGTTANLTVSGTISSGSITASGSVNLGTTTDGSRRFKWYNDNNHSLYYDSNLLTTASADVLTYWDNVVFRHRDSTNAVIIGGSAGTISSGAITTSGDLKITAGSGQRFIEIASGTTNAKTWRIYNGISWNPDALLIYNHTDDSTALTVEPGKLGVNRGANSLSHTLDVGGTVAISGTQIIDASRNATFNALNMQQAAVDC